MVLHGAMGVDKFKNVKNELGKMTVEEQMRFISVLTALNAYMRIVVGGEGALPQGCFLIHVCILAIV